MRLRFTTRLRLREAAVCVHRCARAVIWVWLAVTRLPAQRSPATSGEQPVEQSVELAITQLVGAATGDHDGRLAGHVKRFYAARGFARVWTAEQRWTPAATRLLATLSQAANEGLDPHDYLVPVPDSLHQARADVMLSFVALRFAEDLGWGLTIPGDVHRDHAYVRRPFPGDSLLRAWAAMTADSDSTALARAVRAVAPTTMGYRRLGETLQQLHTARRSGGWDTMSAGPTLHRGVSGTRVAQLRRLLQQRGDLPSTQTAPHPADGTAAADTFDLSLAIAVARFQERHGLVADSVAGAATVAALNVPLATRIEQVQLGMERARWLPPVTGDRWITVNLADYRAFVFDDGMPVFSTRVVIGKVNHETPMFTDTLTNIVLNPAWNVPPSIATKEILPKLQHDPQYLVRNHMVRVNGAIQQLPGPWNSLGQIAFMFPNRFNVYMHDTPAKVLFEAPDRAHSHGCIRVQRPHEMATLLLAAQGWTRARLDSVIATGARTVVWLVTPVPVRITYATAFIDGNGTLQFRRDVYGRDALLRRAITQERSRPLPRLPR